MTELLRSHGAITSGTITIFWALCTASFWFYFTTIFAYSRKGAMFYRTLLQRLYCITCREYSVSWESTSFIRTQDDVHKFRFQTLISESHPTKSLRNCKSTVLLWCWCEVQGLEAGRPNVFNLHYSKCYRNNQFCAIMVSRKTPSRKVLQFCYL